MTTESLSEAIEQITVALQELNRIQGRREALAALNTEDHGQRRGKERGEVADTDPVSEAAQLRMVLQSIDAARGNVVAEINKPEYEEEQ